MRGKLALLAFATALCACGCVERRMLIRSEPAGAPVWVDEEYVGQTPVDLAFAHYGARRVRVGPIRDELDKVRHLEQERVVEVRPPWYEKFPIDFFSEVIWPGRLVDEHRVAEFSLDAAVQRSAAESSDRVEQVQGRAAQFREEALRSIPEEPSE